MTDRDEDRRRFGRTVGRKAERRIAARRSDDNVWFWLGMLGLVGWSVAIPTVVGVAVGIWLDRVAPAGFSWVLTMLVVGLSLGLLNAWIWVSRESGSGPNAPEPGAAPASGDEEGKELP